MAVFNDVVSAHEDVVNAILEEFSDRGMVVKRKVSATETSLDDLFVFITVATWEDGHRVSVKDENKQRLFDDEYEAWFETPEEVVSVIRDSYNKL